MHIISLIRSILILQSFWVLSYCGSSSVKGGELGEVSFQVEGEGSNDTSINELEENDVRRLHHAVRQHLYDYFVQDEDRESYCHTYAISTSLGEGSEVCRAKKTECLNRTYDDYVDRLQRPGNPMDFQYNFSEQDNVNCTMSVNRFLECFSILKGDEENFYSEYSCQEGDLEMASFRMIDVESLPADKKACEKEGYPRCFLQ